MSILSGAIGTMKKKEFSSQLNYQVDGTYNSKTYFVANKTSGERTLMWKTTNTSTAGVGGYIDGLASSNIMNNADHPAAYFCRNLSIGGYGAVWFMPAKNELTHIYTNISASGKLLAPNGSHPDKFTTTNYWTTSEDSATNAWVKNMSTGGNSAVAKNSTNVMVRACRTV